MPNTPSGYGGENPEVTLEQVCHATVEVGRDWLRDLRGTSELGHKLNVLDYQQKRNAAARASKKQRIPVIRTRKKPRRKRPKKRAKRSAVSRR